MNTKVKSLNSALSELVDHIRKVKDLTIDCNCISTKQLMMTCIDTITENEMQYMPANIIKAIALIKGE